MRRLLLAFVVTFAVALPVTVLAVRSPGDGDAAAGRARAALPDAPRPGEPTDERIRALQATVRAEPLRAAGYTLLAGAYLQKVRETGDAGYYERAEGVLASALALAPSDPGALTQRAALALARHDFHAGLADARRARALAPEINKPFAVLVDALVELGRYRPAGRALQQMIDRHPDLAGYARVSYFRELHGDLDGAASALRLAISAGGDVPESDAYVRALLGQLELVRGDLGAARRAFGAARAAMPGYIPAEVGLARVDVAGGRFGPAIARLRAVVERLPLPEHVIALAEAERVAGRRAAARRDLDLVRAEQRLLAGAGVRTDVELALFEADHGSPARAVALARRAWSRAPSIRSADALGWALARSGRPRAALPWARRALRLGSKDPTLLFHAGMAARAAGDAALAERWLRGARAGRAALSPLAQAALR